MITPLVRGRLAAGIAVVAAALLLSLSGAATQALAAPSTEVNRDVLVSSDGVHFSTNLDAGVFGSFGLVIPGGSMRSTLWIQNPSDQPANVRVSLRESGGASADLAQYLTLRVEDIAAQTVMTVPLSAHAGCAVLAPTQPLAAGATLQLAVAVEMMNVTGLTGQNARTDLNFLVALRDAEAGSFPSSACDDDGVLLATAAGPSEPHRSGALPRTGVDLPIPALIGGGLLLGVGVLLVTRRRARREA